MSNYDAIADQYLHSRELTFFNIADYSIQKAIGDIRGKTILDIGCGDGRFARKMRRAGAGRVVGVDVSSAMIELAKQHERDDQLQIHYVQKASEELGVIGKFDVVVAEFLLHYASDCEHLNAMCATAYNNLRPGGAFIAVNDNSGKGIGNDDVLSRYGIRIEPASMPLQDGTLMCVTLESGGRAVQVENYYYGRATYTESLKKAGFRAIRWCSLVMPPQFEGTESEADWKFFFEISPIVMISCEK